MREEEECGNCGSRLDPDDAEYCNTCDEPMCQECYAFSQRCEACSEERA